MEQALAHFVGLLFASGTVLLGRLILGNPDRAIRFFLFGSDPPFAQRPALIWAKFSGWLFTVIGTFGLILYLVMIPIDLAKR